MPNRVSWFDEGAHTVAVWDPFVRLFHWSTAVLVLTAYFTTDGPREVHFAAGYAVFGLVTLRLLWGVVGSRHARFHSFVRGPQEVLGYLRSLWEGRPEPYVGHNPAGGAMVVVMLLLLMIVPVSGWLSQTDAFFGVPWVDHLHHMSGHLLIILAGVHVCGVLVSSYVHRENLILAMVIGRKPGHVADKVQGEHRSSALARGKAR